MRVQVSEREETVGKGAKATTVLRRFVSLRDEDTEGNNLTELRASTDADHGFFRHNDWVGHLLRYQYATKHLEKLRSGARVLDVGCGEMQMVHHLWRNRCLWPDGMEYWGIDLRAQEEWLETARPRINTSLVRGDICVDDFTAVAAMPRQFDLVVSFESFEHVPVDHQPMFMKRLFNWTKSGAACLFSTPNAGVSDSVAENHCDPVTGASREMTYDDKIALAEGTGFVVEKTFGVFCGITRLSPRARDEFKTSRAIAAMKEFLDPSMFTSVIAAAFPRDSNNALMVLRKP